MKKLLMALVLMPPMALADTQYVNGRTWTYQIEGISATVTGVDPSAGDLIIPERLGGLEVRVVGYGSDKTRFYGKTDITSVVFPSCLTKIRSAAFKGCKQLKAISLPSSLLSIEDSAFAECQALEEVFFPDSLESMGICVFDSCLSLYGVSLSQQMISSGFSNGMFGGCENLKVIFIKEYHDCYGYCYLSHLLGSNHSSFADVYIAEQDSWKNWHFNDIGSAFFTVHAPFSDGVSTSYCDFEYWSPTYYTTYFNANGGSVYQTSKSYPAGIPYGALPTPWKAGYKFDGWYTSSSGGSKVTGQSIATYYSRTLYAHWSKPAIPIKVTFNANGGSGTMAAQTFILEQPQKLNANKFTRSGYVFAGWQKMESWGGLGWETFSDGEVMTFDQKEDVVLYATWRKETIVLTFDANGGTCSTKSVRVKVTDSFTMPTPTRSGYKFVCWSWCCGTGVKGGITITPLDSAIFSSDMTFTAEWEVLPSFPASYRTSFSSSDLRLTEQGDDYYQPVVMDPGGAEGIQRLYERLSWASYSAPECPYSRSGFKFAGWNFYSACFIGSSSFYCKGSNCGGLVGLVQPGDSLDICGVSALVATWESIPCLIRFNANGGTCSTVSKSYAGGSAFGTLPSATRAGYSFAGWFTSASGGTRVDSSAIAVGDATYYAHWTANTYALTFNANGGSVIPSSKSITYDSTYGTLPTPSRAGATFLGWFTSASGGTQVSSSTKVTGGATVYAHWKVDVYSITFDANGGRCAEASRSREYGATYGALPTPTQTGYLFLGWYTAPSGGTSVSATTVATGNATVYAHWSKEKMSVGCTWLSEGVFTAGVAAGAGDGLLLDDYVTTESGVASIVVKNLPAGMSYDARKRTIAGFPNKAGTYNVEIAVTAKSGAVEKQTIPLTVEALPAWAVGNFAGWVDCADGTHGTASLSVTAAGAVSGKFLEHGSSWTFTAKSYDVASMTRGERQSYLINAEAVCGKAKRTVGFVVRDGAAREDTSSTEELKANIGLATGDLGGGETVEMWRNVWAEAEPKAYLATIAGKYTYFLTDGKSEPVALPLSLNSSSALLSGSVKIPWQANRSVTFSTTAFASSNGVEAVFYVAPFKSGATTYPEFFEHFTLIPESGEREAGKAHRNPGVLASAVPHEKGGNGSVSVSPAGGQVDAGKTVTLTATAKSDSVFVRWEGTQGSRQFVDPNAKLVLTMDGEHDVFAEAVFRLRTSFDTPEVVVDSEAEYALKRISVGVPVSVRPVVRDEENMLPVKWSAQNLPTGLKIDATTGEIIGVATAINSKSIVIIATSVADSKKVGKAELAADVKPEALPAWAVGDFLGSVRCADGTHGTASFTVSVAGKVTNGKLLEHGSNWTFTAASYAAASVTRGAEREFVIVADAACNKVKRAVELHIVGCPSAGVAESASGTSFAAGPFGDDEVELWRNVWKDADAKGIAAGIAGKYTYFLADDTALPLNLTSAGVLSGKVNVPVRGNASVSFSTTVFASSNGVEAAFYVAPDTKKGYGEIYERFTLVPESGEKEQGRAHRNPGVVAVPESYVSPEGKVDTGMGSVSVSPAGGQVDAGKTVTVSATADAKSVFVKWRYEVGGETLYSELSKLTLTMDGEHDVKAYAIFRSKGSFAAPVVAVETSEQAKFKALELGVQFSAFVTVEDVENMKPVKWSAANLPSGLKINAETGEITGVATAVNTKPVTITATSVADSKKKATFTLDIGAQDGRPAALPETAVGTFTGFVYNGTDNLGTFTFTSSEKGVLSAKVIDAAGTVSFSGSGFAWSKDGKYGVNLETKKGETLTLTLDSGAGWDKDQLTGTYKTSAGLLLNVTSQRNAFSKAWYFAAEGDETMGWTLAFTNDAKTAALTVTLKADGTTSIAGTLNGTVDAKGKPTQYKVSASGVANAGMMREGAMAADFAPVLTVNKVKTVLAIRTNLWFDRKNDHDTGVGEARFVK